MNQRKVGGVHSKTLSQVRNHGSSRAARSQKPSGSVRASSIQRWTTGVINVEPLTARSIVPHVADPAFRPLARSDFPLLHRWLHEPHVLQWWREPFNLADLEAKYGPAIDGREAAHVFVIEYRHQPIGWIQWYRWRDFPDHARKLDAGTDSAGIDLAIGEPSLIGVGLGPAAIRAFIKDVVSADPTIRSVVTDPETNNERSLRAFIKAGFRVIRTVQLEGETFERSVVSRDLL